MRITFGLLLAALWLPCGSATIRVPDMAALAGVPIRVFDLRAEGISEHFREFLESVPMTNDRPVPGRLVDDTVASLSFVRAATPEGMPAYFVAAWIHKTPLVRLPESDRDHYLARYGEEVYPQSVCPVFLSASDGSVARMLGVATGLPAGLFRQVPGRAAAFDRLFALTEASHCGFIARELAHPTVMPPGLGEADTRTILEALGDFEATAILRSPRTWSVTADEADVLFAARLLAMFFHDRETAYTAVPGLIMEYPRLGAAETHRALPRIRRSVHLARSAVRAEPALGVLEGRPLDGLAAAVDAAREEGRLTVDDPLARRLLELLPPALRLLGGDRTVRIFPGPAQAEALSSLVTLRAAATS